MKALTNIFKNIVQNDLDSKTKNSKIFSTQSSYRSLMSQPTQKTFHKKNSVSEHSQLVFKESNLSNPQILNRSMNRNNSSNFSCEVKALKRKNSGKVCSHRVGKVKAKKQVKQAPEVTPQAYQTSYQND